MVLTIGMLDELLDSLLHCGGLFGLVWLDLYGEVLIGWRRGRGGVKFCFVAIHTRRVRYSSTCRYR